MSDKTEAPTPKRIAKAREKGDVAVSGHASQAVAFWVGLLLAPSALEAAAARATTLLGAVLAAPDAPPSPMVAVFEVLRIALPLLLATAATSALITLVQTGGLFAPARVAPDLARLDLIAGLAGLVNPQRLWMVVRAALAATSVGLLAWLGLRGHLAELAHTLGHPREALLVAGRIVLELARRAAAVGLAVACVDLIVTHRTFLAKLRMTQAEVKREHRESEGDPHLKAARRRAHQEVLSMATVHAVREATVVIVNPEHLATALRYTDGEDDAPTVVAQGEGELARRIRDAALAYGVPVVRDVPVARALAELEIGDAIPEALYESVAEILREIWESDEAKRGAPPNPA